MQPPGPRKYVSEFSLNMMVSFAVVLQQEDLDQISSLLPSDSPPLHLYFIGRRPRIGIDPSTFRATAETISGSLLVQSGADVKRVDFECANRPENPILRIESSWPYSFVSMYNAAGDQDWQGKTALFAPFLSKEIQPELDLEVLYVGQAFGDDGQRTAPDRLQAHSTLQAILAEASRMTPDKEVWLVLVSVEPVLFTSIDGTSAGRTMASMDEDDNHLTQVLRGSVSLDQQINVAEAAFINYFQPKHNSHFRKKFPSPAHSTYTECYGLDLNAIMVEFDSTELRLRLFSSTVPPRWVHLASFQLHDIAKRAAFFDGLLSKAT